MAKKRAECGEGDGISTSENEIKAYATNSQAVKGGFWMWSLNGTVHSILTERKIKNTRELITITERGVLISPLKSLDDRTAIVIDLF